MTDRQNLTPNELAQRVEKHGPKIALADVQAEGIAIIKDKDGNIKSRMRITSDIASLKEPKDAT